VSDPLDAFVVTGEFGPCGRCRGPHHTTQHAWTLGDEQALVNGAVSDVNPDPAANWRILYELKREQVHSLTEANETLHGWSKGLEERCRSLAVERDAALERAESAEGELDDLSTLVHYDGGDSRGHLGECFSSVMDQWRHGRAAFKALRSATTPKAEAQAICDLYGALFPDESDEDAPTEPDYEEDVDRLTEASSLRARLSRAREALGRLLGSGHPQHSLEALLDTQAESDALAALRAALSEPPGEAP
jgi:hypothetical protein